MIKNSQYFLSRLYTEAAYRQKFFVERNVFYEAENITDKDLIDFLDQLKEEQINFFAKSLLSKRWHAVKNMIPLSIQLSEEDFENRFIKFSDTFLPKGIHKHHLDALAFIEYALRLKIVTNDSLLRSALKFEKDTINNFLYQKKICLTKYCFDPFSIKNQPHKIKRSTTFILWRKGSMRKIF